MYGMYCLFFLCQVTHYYSMLTGTIMMWSSLIITVHLICGCLIVSVGLHKPGICKHACILKGLLKLVYFFSHDRFDSCDHKDACMTLTMTTSSIWISKQCWLHQALYGQEQHLFWYKCSKRWYHSIS